MERSFNITGACNPQEHYMVNLDSRLAEIKKMVDAGKYFVINRGRQYGKTTTLKALEQYLSEHYIVVRMDFQFLEADDFENAKTFVKAFARELYFNKTYHFSQNKDIISLLAQFKKISTQYTINKSSYTYRKYLFSSYYIV